MIFTDELPTTKLDWKYVWGEVLELIEEIKRCNPHGIIDELCDVYTCSMCAIETSTGIAMPLLWKRTVYNWLERLEFWKKYFECVGLEFKVEYIRNGANYHRRHKRRMAINLAIQDQLRRT